MLRRSAPGLIPDNGVAEGFFQYATSLTARLVVDPTELEANPGMKPGMNAGTMPEAKVETEPEEDEKAEGTTEQP